MVRPVRQSTFPSCSRLITILSPSGYPHVRNLDGMDAATYGLNGALFWTKPASSAAVTGCWQGGQVVSTAPIAGKVSLRRLKCTDRDRASRTIFSFMVDERNRHAAVLATDTAGSDRFERIEL